MSWDSIDIGELSRRILDILVPEVTFMELLSISPDMIQQWFGGKRVVTGVLSTRIYQRQLLQNTSSMGIDIQVDITGINTCWIIAKMY